MDRLLVLTRHGQSEWNLKNLFTGWKDVDLTEVGIAEAKAAGRKLKAQGITFDVGFTSDLKRAQRTMTLMLEEMGQPGIPVIKNVALNERDYGDLSGLNKDDARERWGAEKVHVWRRSYDVPPPGGESLRDTAARVLPYYIQEISAARAARPARARHRPRQFAAGARHGARPAEPEGDHRPRARDRRADGLPAQRRRDGGRASGAGGVVRKSDRQLRTRDHLSGRSSPAKRAAGN